MDKENETIFKPYTEEEWKSYMKPVNTMIAENECLRTLYESLLDFGQDNKLPKEKLDFVKARVFDTTVMLNRIKASSD